MLVLPKERYKKEMTNQETQGISKTSKKSRNRRLNKKEIKKKAMKTKTR